MADSSPPALAYELHGEPIAGTLVFLHGWLLSRHYWQPVVERLGDRHRCLSFDFSGFGDSPACDHDGSPEAYARETLALMDRLGIERAWIVGHSLGGSVAVWAAHLDPERVAGIVGLNAGGGIYIADEFERFRGAGQQLLRFRPGWLAEAPLLDQVFARDSVARPLAAHWGRQRLRDFIRADAGAAARALLNSTTAEQVHRLPCLMAGLRVPAHFIGGDADRIMPPDFVRHLASFHPELGSSGFNLQLLPECGHLAMIEQPDAVARALAGLLAQQLQTVEAGV